MIVFIYPRAYVVAVVGDRNIRTIGQVFSLMPNEISNCEVKRAGPAQGVTGYPFYIVEQSIDGSPEFSILGTNADFSQLTDVVVYTIEKEFIPPILWCDYMGSLPHHHHEAGS